MEHVYEHFLNRMTNVFGFPKGDQPRAVLDEYAGMLAGFDASHLRDGCDDILKHHKYKSWPTIGDCYNACQAARSRETLGRTPGGFGTMSGAEVATIVRSNAMQFFGTLEAKQAARDGYVLGWMEFVGRVGRLPTERERTEIMELSQTVDQYAAGVGLPDWLRATTERLADSILARREQLAVQVLDTPPGEPNKAMIRPFRFNDGVRFYRPSEAIVKFAAHVGN